MVARSCANRRWLSSSLKKRSRNCVSGGARKMELMVGQSDRDTPTGNRPSHTLTGVNSPEPGMLDGLRVIDFAKPHGQYAGKLLADLGADVIKIEPLEGDEARRMGPFKANK